MTECLHIYFDGGCKPNPGMLEFAVVVGERNGVVYHERSGHGTNNDAEWIALLWAMEIARSYGVDRALFIGDSRLVVNQSVGTWKVKKQSLRKYVEECTVLKRQFVDFRTQWVNRAANLAGKVIEAR